MGVIIAIIVAGGVANQRLPLQEWNTGLLFPLGAALATMVAMLFFTLALGASDGNTTSVIALSAIYPGITAILASMFLDEPFTLAKASGLCLAAGAAFLFTR